VNERSEAMIEVIDVRRLAHWRPVSLEVPNFEVVANLTECVCIRFKHIAHGGRRCRHLVKELRDGLLLVVSIEERFQTLPRIRFKPARLLVPDATDLLAAGDAIRLLRSRNGDHPEHAQRDFWNDVIIAVSCRRRGRVLISRDQDHARIAAVVRHHVLTALPT
jgi:hypothetical protein